MRSSSVPLTPATGSAAQNGFRRSTSFQATTSSVASARAVSRSSSDRPEPSNMRTPASGTPASARSRNTMRTPSPVVPASPASAPSSFRISSAMKLSLSRSISFSTSGNGSDSICASPYAPAGARPTATAPAVIPCRSRMRRSWPAAASAGCRAVWPSYRPRSTTSAESGGDSLMKNAAFQPGAVRCASNHDSSASTRPSMRVMPSSVNCSASPSSSGDVSVGSP